MQESEYYEHQPRAFGLVSRISYAARRSMFDTLMSLSSLDENSLVLDVGVTSNKEAESNFFEKWYPHTHNITAVGIEDAAFLEEEFKGLTFLRYDGGRLPFPDNSFDLSVSFAVIEHVGSREKQAAFVKELCRVGKCSLITTPNRWYPIEFHTLSPFLHWLPKRIFRLILRAIGNDFYAREENLNLLDRNSLFRMFPSESCIIEKHHRLLGPVSNLMMYSTNAN